MTKKMRNPNTGEVVELVDGRWVPWVDRERGAPLRVRMAVGDEGRSREDRLATLRRFYPEAAMADDGTNMVFRDPGSGELTLYNPPGFDVGDLGEHARAVPEMAGGLFGAALGMAAPPGAQAATVPLGAGLGAEAAGGFYDWALSAFGPRVDTRGFGQRAADAAAGVAVNAAGQQVGDALPMALRGGLSAVRNRMAGTPGAAVLDDIAGAGAPLDGAMSAGAPSPPVQGTMHALATLPSSAGTVRRATDRTTDALQAEAQRIAGEYGSARTGMEAGAALQRGVQRFRAEQIGPGGKAEKLYGALDEHIPPGVMAPMPETAAALEGPARLLAKYPHIANEAIPPKFSGMLKDLHDNAGAMPWETLKEFRSMVGRRAGAPSFVPSDIPTAEWRKIYGSLSADMRAFAASRGPGALRAFDRASAHWRGAMGRMERLEKIASADTTEKALRAALSGSRDGNTLLRTLRKSVPDDDWGDVAAYVTYRLGTPTPGAQNATGTGFSVNTFTTSWNKLAPAARDTLFGSRPRLHKELQRLVRAVGGMKDSEALRNKSNTAAQNFYIGLLTGGPAVAAGGFGGGVSGAAAAGATVFGVPWAMGRLMTSPRFVRWMAEGTRAVAQPNTAIGHITRLAAIAEAEPEFRSEIDALLEAFRETPIPGQQAHGAAQP